MKKKLQKFRREGVTAGIIRFVRQAIIAALKS
jgi:hypothetical protein